MKIISTNFFLLVICFCFLQGKAENNINDSAPTGGAYIYASNDAAHPCITAQEYRDVEAEIARNLNILGRNNNQQNRVMTTQLSWPLKAAPGVNDCGFHFIGAFVDEDTLASSIKDFDCLTNTYNGHFGTDIAVFPYGFYKMDNNQIQVVAAAPGTIIARSDGFFDRNCSSNTMTANYIIIQHADGSVALYWHMKKNSVTAKTVGQSVAVGEYLGVIGSSGSSSGPHLHFEIWSSTTVSTRKDPYSGTCNYLNASSWWAAQKPHTDPAILKVSVNTTDLVMSACPTTETPNESSSYTIPFQGAGLPAGYAKFYIFLRELPAAATVDLKILNPNGSTFNSWTYTVNSFNKVSYWGWSKLLPTIAGTYKFQATYNGITCLTNFDIVTNATATITASGPTTFCQGDSVILTANSGTSYLWSNGATTRSITVKANGSFSVTVTNGNGNSATSAATTVTVNTLPTANITASGNTVFCQGDSVILTASVGSSYLWNNGATTRSITVKANGSFSVKVTNANNCSATSAATTVTVNALPTANITANGNTIFCQGDSVILTASAGTSYLWNNGATTRSITVKANGSFTVKVTNANNCSATSAATTVTVNALPTATITASGNTVLCQGDSVILTASVGSSYLWNNGATTRSITVKANGSFSVKVTNANNCSATSAATTVTVNALPTATITASGNTVFCQGDSVILTASVGTSYLWNNGATTRSITVKANGSFTVKVTNANNCSATSAATTVTVNALPTATITASGNTVLCQGDSVILTASVGSSYLWNNGATTRSITVKANGSFSVKVTNANNCSATSAATTVTVNALPTATITASGNTIFCQGDSVILTASAGSSYLWNNGATTRNITIKNNGSFTVKVTNANNCSATSAATTVTVNALPTATITASGNTVLCQGDSVILTASVGTSYLWNNGATTRSITVKANGSFSVKVTNANNCSATSAATTVTVNALPTATITANGNTVFCQGDSVILTASVGSSYLWNNSATTRSITVKANGSFTVKVTNANNCSATSVATTVTVRSPQNSLIITLRNDTLFSPYTMPVKWYLTGNTNSIDNNVFHVCSQTGNYYVIGHDANGCTATSATFSANCSVTGISIKTNAISFDIYPNPVNNILTIAGTGIENGNYKFALRNIIGQLIFAETISVANNQIEKVISVSELAADVYFLSIESKNAMFVKTVLKK